MSFTYEKKPVQVQAIQHKVLESNNTVAIPGWYIKAILDGIIYEKDDKTYVKTLEGDYIVGPDDYIIQGVKGELYPCKPDIFKMTYTKVPDVV